MNHGPRFHALLEEVCPEHRALQREMKGWRLDESDTYLLRRARQYDAECNDADDQANEL